MITKSKYQKACSEKCKTCKASEGGGGGKPLGPNTYGYCEHYCSKWGYCGTGPEYWKDGADCRLCYSGKLPCYNRSRTY